MAAKISRREVLLGVSSALILPAACTTTSPKFTSTPVFAHGVASGDPDHSSIVLWTRVSSFTEAVDVEWYVATDSRFKHVVATGRFQTNANRDYTVKVVADNLQAGKVYYYRFGVSGDMSPWGRTRTLPTGHVDKLVIAVASCSNFPFGYFNAYEAIANDPDVDIVAHLGDYIYEYGEDGYGGTTGERLDRTHSPRHEIVSLADYRMRHAQYKTDPGSLAMHAQHPMIAIWDDHESANNPWMEGAENHQPEEGDWGTRRAVSLQAYYEWMPVRDPAPGGAPEKHWRHFKFGDLASLITLESRHTGRSKQIEYGDLSRFETRADANAFYQAEAGAPGRNFLSREQEDFLAAEFRESVNAGRRWRIIGNQSVMAKSVVPSLDDPFFAQLRDRVDGIALRILDYATRLGELGLTGDLDSWGGYPVARERFYQVAKDAGVRDLLVISGDSHGYWANVLYDDDGGSMGVELGTTGISAPRTLQIWGMEALNRYDSLNAAHNKEIVWANGQPRGYIRLALDHDGAKADYVSVTTVETRDYDTRIVYTANIVNAGGMLHYK
jgi:alkaline phosphatase D